MGQTELIVLSAAVAGGTTLLFLLASLPWKAEAGRFASLPAIGIAAGFMVAMKLQLEADFRVFPPAESWQWVFWIGALAAFGALIELIFRDRAFVRWIIWPILIAAGFTMLGWKRMNRWTAVESTEWLAIAIGMSILIAFCGSKIAKTVAPRAVAFSWTIAIAFTSLFIILLGSFERLSNLQMIVGVECGFVALTSFIFPKFRPGFAVWASIALLSVAVTTAAMEPWHASLPVSMAIPAMAALLGCLAAILGERSSWWKPAIVAAIATIAILVWPTGHAVEEYQELREQGFAP